MKASWILAGLLVAGVAQANDHASYEKGRLLSMSSVSCGFQEKGGKSVTGELMGTDADQKNTQELLCQEYVLETEHIVYHIRPKDSKHPKLLSIGESVRFRIDKDKMKLRVPEADDKERDYIVVSMAPREAKH